MCSEVLLVSTIKLVFLSTTYLSFLYIFVHKESQISKKNGCLLIVKIIGRNGHIKKREYF